MSDTVVDLNAVRAKKTPKASTMTNEEARLARYEEIDKSVREFLTALIQDERKIRGFCVSMILDDGPGLEDEDYVATHDACDTGDMLIMQKLINGSIDGDFWMS